MEHLTASTSPGPFSGGNGFGPLEDAIRFRVRLLGGDGREKEWRSQTIQAYKRLTKRAEAIVANTCLAGINTRRVRRALAGLVRGQGRQGRGEPRLAQGEDRLGELAGSGLVGRGNCPADPGRQAPGEDPMCAAQRGNRGHAVLGLEGLGPDHHAPRRWLANAGPGAGQAAD